MENRHALSVHLITIIVPCEAAVLTVKLLTSFCLTCEMTVNLIFEILQSLSNQCGCRILGC